MSDDAKKTILSRRARFIAAAIAGMSSVACGKENAAQPCLEINEPSPAPCLTALPPSPPPTPDAGPEPCLSAVKTPPPDAGAPRPCLEMAPPKKDAGR